MKHVLVVEDEPRMRELIADYFKEEGGFRITEAKNGQEAVEKFAKDPADAVVLDVMMPFLDGFGVCEAIRRGSDAVIVLVTAKSEEDDKLHGYGLGADDYVTKPFSPKVLVAKVKALLKRADKTGSGPELLPDEIVYRIDGLEIREFAYELTVDGRNVGITPKEFELLLTLCRNRNRVLSRELLLDRVWGIEYDGDPRTVDTHIKRLRQKLGPYAACISTVRGNGYSLKVSP